MERQNEQRAPSDTKPPAAGTASKAAEAPATTQKQSPPPPAPAQGAVQQQSAEDKSKAAATRPQNSNPTGGGASNTSQPRQLNQSPNPGPLRLARALAAVGVDVPDKVAKDPQFAAAMNQAEKYYQQYKTDPRARNFINADEYVAMHLSLESKGMVSAWLRDNAAGTLSTQSAEGLNRRLANKQSYDEWAKYNTGWRGFFKDQISIAKAEAYGAKGGLSIATNTFTFHLSDKWHLTNSQQYQGADFTASRVFATVSREAFIFAATAGTAQLARGGVEGLSISARVINTLAQSEHAVQVAGVVTKGLAAADLARGTYEAGGGIHEVIKNPTDYHGYLDTTLGTLQAFGGSQSLHELGGATKVASNVGKVTEAVGQEAKQVEKAAATVAKETGSGEKAVAAAAHESGQAAKETGDATKEVSHATHELSQADKAVAATSKEGTGAANAARQAEKNVAAPADQAVAESKEVASHTARQSEKALGEVKEAATTEQGVAKAEQTATESVKHNVGVGAQQEEAAAHVAQAGGQAASKTEQTVTKAVKEGEGVVEQVEKETVQSVKQAERAAAERAGATQGERSAGRAAEETTRNVKQAERASTGGSGEAGRAEGSAGKVAGETAAESAWRFGKGVGDRKDILT